MARVIKADVSYSGAASLLTVDDVSFSAQEIYNSYAARVAADGGVVVSPAACQDAISWLLSRGLLSGAVAVSAAWGVKKDGAGLVSKIYGLNGRDFVTASGGTQVTHVTTGSFPVFKFPASADTSLISVDTFAAITGRRWAMGMSAKHVDVGANRRMACSYHNEVAGSGSYAYMALSVNDAFPGALNVFDSAGAVVSANAAAPYADFLGNVGYFSGNIEVTQIFRDGVAGVARSPASGQFQDLSGAIGRISLGRYRVSGAMTGFTKNAEIAEFWLLNGLTAAHALELSQRLAAAY